MKLKPLEEIVNCHEYIVSVPKSKFEADCLKGEANYEWGVQNAICFGEVMTFDGEPVKIKFQLLQGGPEGVMVELRRCDVLGYYGKGQG